MSAYNAREFHHVYPKAFLAAKGITFHEANVIANVCMLTASDNNQISDKDPVDYVKMMPRGSRRAIFKSALIPDLGFTGAAEFSEFIDQRAEHLSVMAGKLILGKVR
ncbi:hypothetical protein [Stenotrophomonas sp. AR026]|uniref:hypothetical protein n=1 Tax=Stenotrophomonas sp. AR026 TaxID=3398462 RepID=UPI003BB09590